VTPGGWCSLKIPAGQANFRVDSYPMMSYRKEKGGLMAVDFEALDLVRAMNKSRTYSKRIEELEQQVTELGELVKVLVRELPEDKRWSFEERLKKIKKGG
jgi:hypothetical protein|tara:strand:- start:38 stop:337 length:300 start_codon:yes stop_codon:yes gene_type:complete